MWPVWNEYIAAHWSASQNKFCLLHFHTLLSGHIGFGTLLHGHGHCIAGNLWGHLQVTAWPMLWDYLTFWFSLLFFKLNNFLAFNLVVWLLKKLFHAMFCNRTIKLKMNCKVLFWVWGYQSLSTIVNNGEGFSACSCCQGNSFSFKWTSLWKSDVILYF